MSRRTALIALGAVAAALWLYLITVDNEMKDAGGPGIVEFEFAWNQHGAEQILEDWGEEGRDAARKSLWVDFAFLLAYGAFFALAAAATRDLARDRGWARLAELGAFAVPLAVVAPACDAAEDVNLLLVLDGRGGDAAPLLAGLFATVKFVTLAAVQLYVVAGLVRRLADRWRAR